MRRKTNKDSPVIYFSKTQSEQDAPQSKHLHNKPICLQISTLLSEAIVAGSESVLITLQPQVAMTIIDQYTGEVKAMVGGRGEKSGSLTWNRATDTTRQPGSSFKMLTAYSAALDTGAIDLDTNFYCRGS